MAIYMLSQATVQTCIPLLLQPEQAVNQPLLGVRGNDGMTAQKKARITIRKAGLCSAAEGFSGLRRGLSGLCRGLSWS